MSAREFNTRMNSCYRGKQMKSIGLKRNRDRRRKESGWSKRLKIKGLNMRLSKSNSDSITKLKISEGNKSMRLNKHISSNNMKLNKRDSV